MKPILFSLGLLLAGCGSKSDYPRVRFANVATGLQTQFMPITLAGALGY